MAKVAFSKLNCKVNANVGSFEFNDQTIEVKAYLPIQDKFDLAARVLDCVVDDSIIYNPEKVNLFLTLEILYAYTNITFTDKQKEDPGKLYDMIVSSGLADDVFAVLPDSEAITLQRMVYHAMDDIYAYRNSARAIASEFISNSEQLKETSEQVMKNVSNAPEGMKMLKDTLDKLG